MFRKTRRQARKDAIEAGTLLAQRVADMKEMEQRVTALEHLVSTCQTVNWSPTEGWVLWYSDVKAARDRVHVHLKTPEGQVTAAMVPTQAREIAARLLEAAEEAERHEAIVVSDCDNQDPRRSEGKGEPHE